jgi:hypothetical protein
MAQRRFDQLLQFGRQLLHLFIVHAFRLLQSKEWRLIRILYHVRDENRNNKLSISICGDVDEQECERKKKSKPFHSIRERDEF